MSENIKINVTHKINKPATDSNHLLNIFYINIRSIRHKHDELKQYLFKNIKFIYHIIIITESWIKKDEIKYYDMDNYNLYASTREDREGGGILMYIHTSLISNLNFELSNSNNNYICIYLRKLQLNVIAFYNTNNTDFYNVLDSLLTNKKNCILVGDANIDLLKHNTMTTGYTDIIHSNGFSIINKIKPTFRTRESNTTKTIIDHVLTDIYKYKYNMIINSHHFTDHESITLQVQTNTKIYTKKT